MEEIRCKFILELVNGKEYCTAFKTTQLAMENTIMNERGSLRCHGGIYVVASQVAAFRPDWITSETIIN